MTLRALIVDDHTLVSQGLELMLSMIDGVEPVAVVDSGEKALEVVARGDIDLVLMDVNLGPHMSGIETTERLKESVPKIKVLMLTMFTDPATVTRAVKAGADGYLSKGASREAVERAIRDVMEGRSVLDPNVTKGVFGALGKDDPHALTDRELDILQELSDQKSTREIGEALYLSEDTVRGHLKAIFRKLQVRDRAEAVSEAFRRGLVH
ncbi:MAG TPA: response regulator transcription factor [Actinomycetota bacterium]|nr:response regulator transcription factor [Actinomycetota bacterium]